MKNLKAVLSVLSLTLVMISCSSSEEEDLIKKVTTQKISNLHASGSGTGKYTGAFTKFSFSEGKQVDGDNWDIAFRATEIIVNGGSKGAVLEDIDRVHDAAMVLKDGIFSSIIEAPSDSEFKQDGEQLALETGSGKGWYNYDHTTHLISPIPGKVLLVKTHNGHYAKIEFLSYYKDAQPSMTGSQYYTFNYIYNPNKGDKELQ